MSDVPEHLSEGSCAGMATSPWSIPWVVMDTLLVHFVYRQCVGREGFISSH